MSSALAGALAQALAAPGRNTSLSPRFQNKTYVFVIVLRYLSAVRARTLIFLVPAPTLVIQTQLNDFFPVSQTEQLPWERSLIWGIFQRGAAGSEDPPQWDKGRPGGVPGFSSPVLQDTREQAPGRVWRPQLSPQSLTKADGKDWGGQVTHVALPGLHLGRRDSRTRLHVPCPEQGLLHHLHD